MHAWYPNRGWNSGNNGMGTVVIHVKQILFLLLGSIGIIP